MKAVVVFAACVVLGACLVAGARGNAAHTAMVWAPVATNKPSSTPTEFVLSELPPQSVASAVAAVLGVDTAQKAGVVPAELESAAPTVLVVVSESTQMATAPPAFASWGLSDSFAALLAARNPVVALPFVQGTDAPDALASPPSVARHIAQALPEECLVLTWADLDTFRQNGEDASCTVTITSSGDAGFDGAAWLKAHPEAAVLVVSPPFTDALPPSVAPQQNARRNPRRAATATAATTEYVRMTPDIATGLIVGFFLIAVLIIALQCLVSVRTPSKFVHKPLPAGKEF